MRYQANRLTQELDTSGYAIVSGVLDSISLTSLRSVVDHIALDRSTAGARNIVGKSAEIRELAHSAAIRRLVEPVIGADARLVRSILFIKDENVNWGVSWHQDLTIAVKNRVEIGGYSGWTIKDGVDHMQPPIEILANMLTVRMHLDSADDSNGALRVVPASHRFGRIEASEAAGVANRLGGVTCNVSAGDTLLLRPLILHASNKSVSTTPRRVIHLEFASVALPRPLEWSDSV